jgi:hypothetical protein
MKEAERLVEPKSTDRPLPIHDPSFGPISVPDHIQLMMQSSSSNGLDYQNPFYLLLMNLCGNTPYVELEFSTRTDTLPYTRVYQSIPLVHTICERIHNLITLYRDTIRLSDNIIRKDYPHVNIGAFIEQRLKECDRKLLVRFGQILINFIGPNWNYKEEWKSSTVVALAQGMYQTQDFSTCPILADALQDQGCNELYLTRLRTSPQNFFKGNVLMDWILGIDQLNEIKELDRCECPHTIYVLVDIEGRCQICRKLVSPIE